MQDNEFIRGSLPMTKSEVRAVSLSKLALTPNSILWDIGAGTGSVAVEAARQFEQMANGTNSIYAIEKDAEGILLIEKNWKKLAPDYKNFSIIQGVAPEILTTLPTPTHVFIGGSGGELPGIVRYVFARNPGARLVINTVTAESLSLCIQLTKDCSLAAYEIVQVAVTRLEPLGRYHMQKAQNPVYIVLLQGEYCANTQVV